MRILLLGIRLLVFLCFSILLVWIILQLHCIAKCLNSEAFPDIRKQKLQCFQQQFIRLHHIRRALSRQQYKCEDVLYALTSDIKYPDIPKIYIITPTYARPVQKAELTRLSHTFRLVPNIHWIVVENNAEKSELVSNFLKKSGFSHTHLNILTPPAFKLDNTDPSWLKPKGVLQRNLGIQWLRDNLIIEADRGVVYFADDDNTYDLDIFEEMRYTKKVSVWPVGLVGGLMVEGPKLENDKVIPWNSFWKPERPFAVDMAGFAVNVTVLLQSPRVKFSLKIPRGYQESQLLKHLVTLKELEPLAEMCSKVMVWHTRTEQPKLKYEKKLKTPLNLHIEV